MGISQIRSIRVKIIANIVQNVLATTAQRPVEKDLFPAKVGDDVDTFQLAIQITFVGGEHFEEADIVQLEKCSLALVTERWWATVSTSFRRTRSTWFKPAQYKSNTSV